MIGRLTAPCTHLLAVDPGTEEAGVALFALPKKEVVDVRLCAYSSTAPAKRRAPHVAQMVVIAGGDMLRGAGGDLCSTSLIVEDQQIYRHGPGVAVDPASILPVTLMAGGVLFGFLGAVGVMQPLPSEWKGQVKKMVMVRRILESLSASERALMQSVNDNHNVVDAVGLGLWALGRM